MYLFCYGAGFHKPPAGATRACGRETLLSVFLGGLLALQESVLAAVQGGWAYYGYDAVGTKYSLLDQVHARNVDQLQVTWQRPAVNPALLEAEPDINPYANFMATPILVDGGLTTSHGIGLVEAMDPGTGETLWGRESVYRSCRGLAGLSTPGVAFWQDDQVSRVLVVRGRFLLSIDVETGKRDRAFGKDLKVDLTRPGPTAPLPDGGTSGPIIVGDVIIVGGGRADDVSVRKGVAIVNIRAFDVRTNEKLRTLKLQPGEGEFSYETWEAGSARLGDAMGAWAPLTAEEELGYVYLGTGDRCRAKV